MFRSKRPLKPKHVLPAVATSLVLGYVVVQIFAAGPAASFLLKNGTLSGNATVVANSSAIGGSMVRFGSSISTPTPTPAPPPPSSPPVTGSCALPRYPTPSCTGVPAGVVLTTLALNVDGDSYAVTTPGAVIDSKRIPGHLLVWADNVTIKNSQIDGNVYNDQGATIHPYTITDSTIGRSDRCETQPGLLYARYTATRVKVIGHDDGFRVSTPGNVTIKDSYAQLCWNPPELAPPDGSHSGGIQADCRPDPGWPDSTCYNVVFNHNTIDNSKVVNGQRVGNSSFTMQSCATANSGCGGINPISGVTVNDNLFMGGGYVMWPWWTKGPNYEIHNNRIVNGSWTYGPVDANGTCAHQNWSGNTIVTLNGYSPTQSYTGDYQITSIVSSLNCAD